MYNCVISKTMALRTNVRTQAIYNVQYTFWFSQLFYSASWELSCECNLSVAHQLIYFDLAFEHVLLQKQRRLDLLVTIEMSAKASHTTLHCCRVAVNSRYLFASILFQICFQSLYL